MPEEEKKLIEKNTPDERETFWAFLSYLPFLNLLVLISPARNLPFVRYHKIQGLIFFIFLVVFTLFAVFVYGFFWKIIISIFLFVIWCLGIICVFLGIKKPLPLIGWVSEKIFKA